MLQETTKNRCIGCDH